MISAIILAAGRSKRMGRLKQLLPLDESTILQKTIQNVKESSVDEIIVVLGYRAKEIIYKLAEMNVKLVTNSRYDKGMSTSIVAGLKAINLSSEAVMIVLGDQPFIKSDTFALLIDTYKSSAKGIQIPIYQGQRGRPVIISTKYREEMLLIKGDVGAKEILARHADDILYTEVNDPGITIDIDTEDDYREYTVQ